jgi:cell division protein FtsW
MGTTNFVKATPTVNQQTKKLRRMRFKVDIPLLITVAVLLIFGLIMVYSSSMAFSIRDTDDNTPYFFFNRQLRFMVMGIVVCFVASRFNYHWLKPLAPFILGAVLVMLFAVLFMPQSADTPKRGLLGGSVQPSELAKVAIVIYLAVWIGKKKEQLNSIISGLLPLGVILGITIILIVAEPDISAMLTVLALGGLLFYVGDGDWRIILGFAVLGLVAFGLTFFVFKALDIHYIQERLDSFKLGGTNMNDIHPHIQHSLAAVVRGGWFGSPLGEGTAKYIGLPVPWTDSIFAVIVEETGFFGGVAVIGAYLVILWRGLKIADEAEDLTGKLLVTGLTAWIAMEAFINIGVMINLFPVAGNALPLISYGGSMMLTTLGAIGLIFSVNRTSNEKTSNQKRRNLDAAVDLRRGDGGWRVSRPDRSSRTEQ